MKWYITFIAVLLFGCKQPGSKPVAIKTQGQSGSIKTKQIDSVTRKQEEEAIADSIQLNKMLKDMLDTANNHKNGDGYHKQVAQLGYSCETTSDIKFGHLFDRNRKHLIIKRNMGSWLTHIDIFILDRSNFRLILSNVTTDMTMVEDSIQEINGDRFKDFVVHWYPSSGCCRRNIYDVYLYQNNNGSFTSKYEFINPTFSPAEKLIRGVNYGHPGEVPLYKYKWNGLKVDTVEYIYPADILKEKFYRVHNYRDKSNPKKREVLATVPKEYLKTDGYAWFIDYEIEKLP